jgi:PleD family two-component response regulator
MQPLKKNLLIYVAVRRNGERSQMENLLLGDGFDVSAFATAGKLWDHFQARPARFIITDKRFGQEFSGLDLAQYVREFFPAPYVYILLRSVEEQLAEIEKALAAGVDDYIIKPPNPVQIRARVMVGLRWLAYLDSLHSRLGNSAPPPAD